MNNKEVIDRENKYYETLKVSERTKLNYYYGINSKYLREYLKENYHIDSIFELTDLEKLWDIYTYINVHPKNVENHRWCSVPIMKYIRFLNHGDRYGRRIDCQSYK